MKQTYFPPVFVQKYTELLGKEADAFFSVSRKKIPKSLWVNALKTTPHQLAEELEAGGWTLTPLFHENAFSLSGVERPGSHPAFARGLFNLQEKAAMLPAVILQPHSNDVVLDMAAAPGNKTLQLACFMQGKGTIVALDKSVQRFRSLQYNVKKFGMKNVQAGCGNALVYSAGKPFDKILLDAPCSSEGLVRKDRDALKHWSPKLLQEKSALQKKLLEKACALLKKNGEMVYSTCSFSPEENEFVLDELLREGKLEIMRVKIKKFFARPGLSAYRGRDCFPELKKALRVYPQDNDSQAFFCAKLRKIG